MYKSPASRGVTVLAGGLHVRRENTAFCSFVDTFLSGLWPGEALRGAEHCVHRVLFAWASSLHSQTQAAFRLGNQAAPTPLA